MNNPLGLHASFVRTLPLPERFSILRDAGFDATALWWEEQREEIRAIRDLAPDLVRQAGLLLDHLHVPYFACNGLWSETPGERAAAFELHTAWIGDCARHGVPRMVMHVTRGKSPPAPGAPALDDFRRLAGRAEDAGVVLAIENTHSPGHIDYLFERIESPFLTLCYDVAHDRLHSATPLDLLRRWGDRVGVMHVSDTDGRRDWHWLPGDGDTDFARVGACLRPGGYRGTLMLEGMIGRDDTDAEGFALRAAEAGRRVRDRLAHPSEAPAESRVELGG
jgi:sugar phosphate isomerase/epimerase